MRHASLFSGIGGFDLAAQWMGWENVFQVEIDTWAQSILKQNFPNSILYDDVKKFDGTIFRGKVEILSGGFPCQDISISGNGIGINGSKSGLWREFKRIISEIRPAFVVIENSPELLRKGFERVLYDLAEIGYDAEWEILSASDFGMPHVRKRLWVLAYPNVQGWGGILHLLKRGINQKNQKTNPLDSSCHPFLQFEQRYSKPAVFGVDDGLPKRLDVVKRLGGCGNAIVPQIAYEIFKAIELKK